MILIRDGAVPFHPIIRISALSSCVVQLTERDEQIGWTRDTVLKHLTEHPTAENAAWLLSALGEAFEALQTDDLVTPQELEAPTPELIESLTTQGKEERKIHQQHAKNHAVKQVQVDAAWAELVGSHLYKSKRALTLASLLETRLAFRKAGLPRPVLSSLLTLSQLAVRTSEKRWAEWFASSRRCVWAST